MPGLILSAKAESHLHKLCVENPSRRVATDFFAKTVAFLRMIDQNAWV